MNTNASWQLARLLPALLGLTILSSCVTDGVTPKIAVQLPPPPAFMQPVGEPAVAVGDDARVAWKRTSVALKDANRRLQHSRGWYTNVRKGYGSATLR